MLSIVLSVAVVMFLLAWRVSVPVDPGDDGRSIPLNPRVWRAH